MNGKKNRVKGCWSRGGNDFSKYISDVRYRLPHFSKKKFKHLNIEQKQVLSYFENYKYVKKVENYIFNKNTPGAIVHLKKKDFDKGTVRLTKPGIYILQDNISFEPNKENDFMPTFDQIKSGQYPVGNEGAYHLGFFAAITIEGSGIILDLNFKTIKQSKLHLLQQRFFAIIETASSPFMPKQGPSILKFSNLSNYKAANFLYIKNGRLSSSSHHGIHGNNNKNIFIHNLAIEKFEVAGCALNGVENCIIDNINIGNSSLNVRVLSLYSQARFIRTWLEKVKKYYPNAEFNGKL